MKIIERQLPLHHFLVRRVFGEPFAYRSDQAHCRIVYFDEYDPKIIAASLVYLPEKDSLPVDFGKLIEEDLTFDDCLAISTLYFTQPTSLIKRIINGPFPQTEDFLSHILKPTNGYLVYSHQLEQLARFILDVPLDEAVRIRKVYNKQQSLIKFSESDDHQLRHFKMIVQERAIARTVQQPNYQGAKNLYLYATSFV